MKTRILFDLGPDPSRQDIIEFLTSARDAAIAAGGTLNKEATRRNLGIAGSHPDDVDFIMHAVFGTPPTSQN